MEFYYQFLSGKAQQTYRCIEQGIKNQRKNILLLGCFSEPYALGAFELSQLRAFDDNVDTLYASADATRLHQIIRMAVQSSTLTEVDLYELRLLLPRILPQEQEDEEAAPASAASEKEDDWNEWSERESQRYRQRRRLLEEQHELLHMLQTLQHQHKEEHRPVLLHHRGHGHQR